MELVFPGGTYGIRKRLVSAELFPVTEALPLLLAADGARSARRSVRVWAEAAAAGVGLVARGRLLPTVGPGDTDVWRAGPLDPSDLTWLHELAAAFPATAHALAIPGSRPMRLRSPESLVRDLWDAIADTIVRSAAAARTTESTAFAAVEATAVGDLAESWMRARCGTSRRRCSPGSGPRRRPTCCSRCGAGRRCGRAWRRARAGQPLSDRPR